VPAAWRGPRRTQAGLTCWHRAHTAHAMPPRGRGVHVAPGTHMLARRAVTEPGDPCYMCRRECGSLSLATSVEHPRLDAVGDDLRPLTPGSRAKNVRVAVLEMVLLKLRHHRDAHAVNAHLGPPQLHLWRTGHTWHPRRWQVPRSTRRGDQAGWLCPSPPTSGSSGSYWRGWCSRMVWRHRHTGTNSSGSRGDPTAPPAAWGPAQLSRRRTGRWCRPRSWLQNLHAALAQHGGSSRGMGATPTSSLPTTCAPTTATAPSAGLQPPLHCLCSNARAAGSDHRARSRPPGGAAAGSSLPMRIGGVGAGELQGCRLGPKFRARASTVLSFFQRSAFKLQQA
jgi:hypothetical protein